MSYEYTGIRVDREVHQRLFQAKERPSEPFNAALRRELGMPAPEADSDSEESAEAEDRTEVSA